MTGRRRQSANENELNSNNHLGFLQEDDLGMSKICVICNEDCSNEPRFKGDDDRYIHQRCYVHEENLSGQLEPTPQGVNNHHSLKLWEFVYCRVCDRPLEKQHCRKRVVKRFVSSGDGGEYKWVTRYYCTQCGNSASTYKRIHGFQPFLGPLLACFIIPPWEWGGIEGGGWLLLTIGIWLFGGLFFVVIWWMRGGQKRAYKGSLNRWVNTHGDNCSQWPTPGRDWVKKHGDDPAKWPPTEFQQAMLTAGFHPIVNEEIALRMTGSDCDDDESD